MAVPQVSWVMTVYRLTGMPVEKSERLAFGQRIVFILNGPCVQLQKMKAPYCAWSIRRDVGQGLRM